MLTSVPFYYDWIAEQCPECVGMSFIHCPETPEIERQSTCNIVIHSEGITEDIKFRVIGFIYCR